MANQCSNGSNQVMADELDIDDDDSGDGTDVTLTELLEQTIALALQSMAGPMIGSVDTYDAASARASVTPLIPLLLEGEMIPAPKLPSVPVLWPRSTTHGYTFPISAGTIVELIPLGHDHSKWLTAGTSFIAPIDDRRFSLSDLAAVLFGLHKVGSNAATKAVGLNQDIVNRTVVPPDAMTVWMTLVETICNGVVPGTFTVDNNALSFTHNGTLTATATKLQAE